MNERADVVPNVITIAGHVWKLSGADKWTCEEYPRWEIVRASRATDDGQKIVFMVYAAEYAYKATVPELEDAGLFVADNAEPPK